MPRIYSKDRKFKDFIIRHESNRGLAGLINLVGIESPGLTASLAIGRYVKAIVAEIIGN
jgi:L-2-hydroxyglutarate oxidase LhgO